MEKFDFDQVHPCPVGRPTHNMDPEELTSRSAPSRLLLSKAARRFGAATQADQAHAILRLRKVVRIALAVTPRGRGTFAEQACEVLGLIDGVLHRQRERMVITVQSVFLRDAADSEECRRLFAAYFGEQMPVTNFLLQPPCNGAALAVEAWAVGGTEANVQFAGPNLVTVSYDGIKWLHCAGVDAVSATAYSQTTEAFARMNDALMRQGAPFGSVVRTWLYQGGITEQESGIERYRELNRARSDVFENTVFGRNGSAAKGFFPASTGIGTLGRGLTTSCLALQTDRGDVRLVALENPLQTPSYCYDPKYSAQSPKFSRAMAVLLGDYMTTWISGTASIVDSETRHVGDAARQTEQTLDNIECLISPKNFARQGINGAGAALHDLAKVRVYVKRAEDYAKCRAVCERRLGPLPAVFVLADICRPDLLVEIEGVAFSKLNAAGTAPRPQ